SEQVTLMSEEIAGMYASLDDPEQYLVHDMRFHQTIAAASGNRILTSLMNMIATILYDSRSKTVKRAKDLKQSAEQHQNIYRAMRERAAESAQQAMHDHLLETQKAQRLEEEEDAAIRARAEGGK
ncbi:MAG: FadR/GntR family transcriptional regulator, partial [Candidatus Binatia bacterium]